VLFEVEIPKLRTISFQIDMFFRIDTASKIAHPHIVALICKIKSRGFFFLV